MSRRFRTAYLFLTDIILINFSLIACLYLRFDVTIPRQCLDVYFDNAIIITILKVSIFLIFKLDKSLWKYASVEELWQIVLATAAGNIVATGYLLTIDVDIPGSLYILSFLLDTLVIGSSRLSYRLLRRIKNRNTATATGEKRVMIIGAGDAGAMVIKEYKNHSTLNSKPVLIIDDDLRKEGTRIHGVPVVGQRSHIEVITQKEKIDEIVIAIPSASKKDIKEIVEICKRTKCNTKILPGIYEIIDGKVNIKQLRDVQIEDLLGRDQVKLSTGQISDYLKGKRILVTGGGGSIGSELCRQIAPFEPELLAILDIYENNAYDIHNELRRKYKGLNLKVIIASVRDRDRIDEVMKDLAPDVIFHAAAHKHVPLMENNPKEAIKNNVFGTLNVAQSADKHGIRKFVMISTDKAVNPTNVMGATKRLCEMIIQSIDKVSKTEFVAVRFGNVLGSNGSVIPLFKRQIAQGGPVTVTHPEIIRYFMTIPEASQLVLQAGAMAKGGEIFILNMGEPVKIMNLAKDLIRLSGLEPYTDIDIQITGLRPGEKLFEELLLDEEGILSTTHEKIFVGKPIFTDYKLLLRHLRRLQELLGSNNEGVISYMMKIVPTYRKAKHGKVVLNAYKANNEVAVSKKV